MEKDKKNRLRFNIHDDLCLLREVLAENPFETPLNWENIKKTVLQVTGKDFTVRSLKEHVEYLIKLFSKEDWNNRKKSGTEEQNTEKDLLLQEIKDLARDFKDTSSNNSNMLKIDKEKAVKFRDDAAASFSHTNINSDYDSNFVEDESTLEGSQFIDQPILFEVFEDTVKKFTETARNLTPDPSTPSNRRILSEPHVLGPVRSHSRSKTVDKDKVFDYLKEKNCTDLELNKRKLDLEERKVSCEEKRIKLEEAKFELEKTERLKRLEMEAIDKENQALLMKQQLELMSLLLNKK